MNCPAVIVPLTQKTAPMMLTIRYCSPVMISPVTQFRDRMRIRRIQKPV